MKIHLLTILLIPILLFAGCDPSESAGVSETTASNSAQEEIESFNEEEKEIIAAIEHFLYVAGNFDLEAMATSITGQGNFGVTRLVDDEWQASTKTFDQYFEDAREMDLSPYYEPVNEYIIEVSEGQLAFARANAVLHRWGVPLSENIDFFTLLKEDGQWKIVHISFTKKELPEDEQVFNAEIFARGYAQAWGSKRKDFVASFFAEDGTLELNSGANATGREAIAELAQGFIKDLPDMVVSLDKLVKTQTGYEFHWILESTHAGTGQRVKVNGYEEWVLSDDGLIKKSLGHFPTEEYNRQLGITKDG